MNRSPNRVPKKNQKTYHTPLFDLFFSEELNDKPSESFEERREAVKKRYFPFLDNADPPDNHKEKLKELERTKTLYREIRTVKKDLIQLLQYHELLVEELNKVPDRKSLGCKLNSWMRAQNNIRKDPSLGSDTVDVFEEFFELERMNRGIPKFL